MRGLKYKNVAAELLAKLLGDEIKVRSKRDLVQSREFSAVTRVKERPGFQMLKKTLNAYHNRAIATQEVIEELIKDRTRRITCAPANAGLTSTLGGFDLLLHMVHHRHASDQDDGRNDLVRMEAGMEESSRDAYCSKRLEHFEVIG